METTATGVICLVAVDPAHAIQLSGNAELHITVNLQNRCYRVSSDFMPEVYIRSRVKKHFDFDLESMNSAQRRLKLKRKVGKLKLDVI